MQKKKKKAFFTTDRVAVLVVKFRLNSNVLGNCHCRDKEKKRESTNADLGLVRGWLGFMHTAAPEKSFCPQCNLTALIHSQKCLKNWILARSRPVLSLQRLPCSNLCLSTSHKLKETLFHHPFLRDKPGLHVKQNPGILCEVGRSAKRHLIFP